MSTTLSPKLEDPKKFTIPFILEKVTIKNALCDLGATVSLMSYMIFEQIGIGELKTNTNDYLASQRLGS
jgi:hypothetical protein